MVTFNKKALVVLIVIFSCLAALFFTVRYYNNNFNTPETIFPITFSPKWVNQAQFAGIFVAKENNFYGKAGLEVNINPFETGDSVMTDLETGSSQLGLMSANEFLINYSNSIYSTTLLLQQI